MKQLKGIMLSVLNYIKDHPGANSSAIADALGEKPLAVMRMLWVLWHKRYITREKGDAKNAMGRQFYQYTFKTDRPRRGWKKKKTRKYMRRTVVAKQVSVKDAAPGFGIDVLIAVKGSTETLVLTLSQAKNLREQLEQLS